MDIGVYSYYFSSRLTYIYVKSKHNSNQKPSLAAANSHGETATIQLQSHTMDLQGKRPHFRKSFKPYEH